MLRITWLIVVDLAKGAMAYATGRAHRPETRPVRPTEGSITITGVIFICHNNNRAPRLGLDRRAYLRSIR